MAVDLAGAQLVGWCNPRSGVLHPLKLSVSPNSDWQPLYVLEDTPTAEHVRLVEVLRQAQVRNRTLLHRLKRLRRHIRELEDALNRRRAEGLRTRLYIGELEDQLSGSRVRMDSWREVANDRTARIAKLEDQVEHLRAEWHKVDDARRNYAIENGRLWPVVRAAQAYVEADDALQAHATDDEDHAELYGAWCDRAKQLKAATANLGEQP